MSGRSRMNMSTTIPAPPFLRGGSHYQPGGSIWYFPQAYRNDQHGKLLLMAPSYDRSGTVGFRCVEDAS